MSIKTVLIVTRLSMSNILSKFIWHCIMQKFLFLSSFLREDFLSLNNDINVAIEKEIKISTA